MPSDGYQEHAASIEASLADCAFKSARIETFTDSTDALRAFENEWRTDEGRARLTGRTPLTLERDRILYSDELRAQSDRHHILFFNEARVTRDYAAHILRMSQVSRAICGRLNLNSDLAEAVALGAKVGGVPFIHVGKGAVDRWVRTHVKELDTASSHPVGRRGADQLALIDEEGNPLPLPSWVDELADPQLRAQVRDYLPWAAGATNAAAYSSGQQSYWALSLRPFQLTPKRPYVPQTMYGVWNHSMSAIRDTAKFSHAVTLESTNTTLSLCDSHLTHEAVVVRYADDISWVIENLSEASKAATLAGSSDDIFTGLARELQSSDMPGSLHLALTPTPDIGKIYTYFINDLVETSAPLLRAQGLERPTETQPAVIFSDTGSRMLRLMKQFLETRVYSDDRLLYRNRTLEAIIQTVLDVFWESRGQALGDYVNQRARYEGWTAEDRSTSLDLLNTPVHRVQACVDALSAMSDRDVYQLLGLEAL